MGGALLVLSYLLWWWIIASAASRRHGALAFALGLGLLAAAAVVWRMGRPQWLYGLWYLSLLGALAALLLEAVLHLRPQLLGGRVANFAYSGYHHYRGGVYELDEYMGPLLRPNVRRWMYWNGHWWRHETNASGWRGPGLDQAAAVFLGDSMIYGHGVEGPETVPARFGQLTGLATANLGQQGTSLVQGLMLLLRRGRPLGPRVVLVCSHPTDLEDGPRNYDQAELRSFLASGRLPRIKPEYGPPSGRDPVWLWARYLSLPLRTGGVLGSLVRGARERRFQEPTASRDPFVPTASEQQEVPPALHPEAGQDDRLGWQVHRQALAEIHRTSQAAGARLVLFDLGYPRLFTAGIEGLAAELGAEYSPAGRVALQRALAGERIYLANDGHWSPRGAEVVAAELARTGAVRELLSLGRAGPGPQAGAMLGAP